MFTAINKFNTSLFIVINNQIVFQPVWRYLMSSGTVWRII